MEKYIALLKVIELNSFTHAAEALGYTQPALSQMVTSLEKELGVTLLSRGRHGVKLTPEGETLFPSIQETVNQFSSMRELVHDITSLDEGTVRIGTISTLSCYWLPPLIEGFWKLYPNVKFALHQADYSTIPEMVSSGTVDMGFINPNMANGLKTTFLKAGNMLAVVPKNHPLAKKRKLTLEELAPEPFILLESGPQTAPAVNFLEHGLTPNVRLSSHEIRTVLTLIEHGQGVGILPELVLKNHATDYKVKIIPMSPLINRRVALVTRGNNLLPIASKYFINYLLEHIDDL